MNQDQLKDKLLQLDDTVIDFAVIFSGKESKKVNGLYKPENKEIIIHNKNFNNDNALVYTAIHEFAHHIQFTTSAVPVSTRAHTSLFWNILHNLLYEAEKKGIYQNVFKTTAEFMELTKKIKEKFLSANGELMKEFGQYLMKAQKLCIDNQVNFDDYADRELNLHHTSAKTIMRCASRDINPKIGYENMKIVAGIKDEHKAKQAEQDFIQGESPDMVKMKYKPTPRPENTLEYLESEKVRVEASIKRLEKKLIELEKRIAEVK